MQQINNRLLFFVSIKEHTIFKEDNFPYSDYIKYNIQVETRNRKWYVFRRYKNFETLHNELQKKIHNLPKFPEKRFFSMSDCTIQERKELFSKYLNFVLSKPNFSIYIVLLDFLDIDKELILLLQKYPTTIHRNTITRDPFFKICRKISKSALVLKDNLSLSSYDKINESTELDKVKIDKIDEFINSLELNKESICQNVKDFWHFVKKTKKLENLNREDIMKLFYGNRSCLNKNGLIFHCGNIIKNVLGSEACLDLIAKLIDYETNSDSENCIFFLKMSRIEHLEKMNLESHLRSNKPLVILNVFKILKVLINIENGPKIDDILKDKNNIEKFSSFLSNCG